MGGRRRGGGVNVWMLFMAFSQLKNFLDSRRRQGKPIPVITFALIVVCVVVYMFPWELQHLLGPLVNLSPRSVCVHFSSVVTHHEYARLLLAGFFHVDLRHLVYNMGSLMWKGAAMEDRMLPEHFFLLSIALLVSSHVCALLISFLLLLLGFPDFMGECAIGISALLFAYKTVQTFGAPENSNIFGFTIPTKYAVWAELLVIYFMVPNSSFVGHMGGILAGTLFMLGNRKYNLIPT
jgi:rhomboid domain-containing protein 1